jgi:FtsX-like permease family
VFAASLDGLRASPHAYGVNWDRLVDDTRMDLGTDKYCGPIDTRLTDERALDGVATVCSASITMNGRSLGALGFRPLRGEIGPTVLDGRAPVARDQVALGSETMHALGISIGDRVVAESSVGQGRYRVVGRVVIPSLVDPQAVADGAVFTGDGLARLEEPQNVSVSVAPVIHFRPGVDRGAAARRIDALPGVGRSGGPGLTRTPVPLEVDRLQQVDRIPLALALFLLVLGALAVGYLLVTSVHRRARDFAVLKVLGFRRRQTYAAVCVQATTVAVVGLVVGLVLGVALGAVLWRAATGRVGVLGVVEFPIPTLALVALGTIVLSNLIAAVPARTAARTPVAVTLHAD